jgi:2-desacetyl-2-hydroxyethyl bacteriochlorophyllide A dehydrogenase
LNFTTFKQKIKVQVLICKTPGELEYDSREKPVSAKGRSIIKIKRIGICGTDIHAYGGTQPFFTYPRILGHELSGVLEETDNSPGFEAGEKVTIIPYFNCNNCIACRNDKPNCCVNMQVCGVHIDGGMAEYLSVPSDSLIHGEGLSFEELALAEPFAIGAHGIRIAQIQQNEFVLVIGAGPIGLCTMQMAQIAGARVIALDINEHRLQFCRDKINIQHSINGHSVNITEELMQITDGDMPTVVIDATGNQKAINNGFKYMAHGGRYILIGLQKNDIAFNHPEFHKRESTLMSSRNATRQDFQHVINCIKMSKIKPGSYITHKAKFDEAKEEFELWVKPESEVIKAMMELPG